MATSDSLGAISLEHEPKNEKNGEKMVVICNTEGWSRISARLSPRVFKVAPLDRGPL